jgi:hypothetical protein
MLTSEIYEKYFRPLKLEGEHYINVLKQWQVCWTDIIYWMWALFTKIWASWRNILIA